MKPTIKTLSIAFAATLFISACGNDSKPAMQEVETAPAKKETVKKQLDSYDNSVTCALESQDCPSLTPLDSALAAIEAYATAWNNVPLPYSVGAVDGEKTELSEETLPLYPTVAFGISVTDMIAAYGIRVEDGQLVYSNDHIRAYIGLEGSPKRQHLYFTPVGEDGNDEIMTCGENQYVMELISPCPNTCEVASPLFQAFDQTLSNDRKAGTNPGEAPMIPISSNCVVNL